MNYKAVNLMIGSACDRKCPYCLQTGDDIPANRTPNLEAFVDGLSRYLQGGRFERLILWGGEPMVYWARIQKLIMLMEKADLTPTVGYFLTTHGRSLTDDYVNYVNQKRFHTTVSAHDWDFTTEQMDRIFKIKDMSISSIIHHYHLHFFEDRERFYKLYETYGIQPKLFLHFLRANDGCAKDFYLSRVDVDKLVQHLLLDVIPLAWQDDDWAVMFSHQFTWDLVRELEKKSGGKCVRDERLSIDLHGNIYQCHHNYDAGNISGSIFDRKIMILSENRHSPDRFWTTPECKACNVFNLCHGGCYLSNTHDVDCYLIKKLVKVYDELVKLPFLAMHRKVWEKEKTLKGICV